MAKLADEHSTSMEDVKQLGLFAAIASLSYVFWIVGAMEMVERLAYYGVKAVAALYATDPVSDGGLGVTAGEFGFLLMLWALVQSILAGFHRRPVRSLRIQADDLLLDRHQDRGLSDHGLLSHLLGILCRGRDSRRRNRRLQTRNPGHAGQGDQPRKQLDGLGRLLPDGQHRRFPGPDCGRAHAFRVLGDLTGHGWTMVFVACALIISCNFLLLLTYKEVGKEERLERARLRREGKLKQENLLVESIQELAKPPVFVYLLIFSGFWFMFNALFDVLPLHIRDWVDRSIS